MKQFVKAIALILLSLTIFSCQEKNQAPFCKITAPETEIVIQKGETLTINIEAFDEDGIVNEVGIFLDQLKIGILHSAPYSFELETSDIEKGGHKLSAYAVDDGGLNSSASINIIIEVYNATVTSDTVRDITINSAVLGGTLTDNGGAEVTEQGICWSTSENPSIDDSKKALERVETTFSTTIEGLESNTTYHSRVYAINENGVAYGEEVIFKTPFELDSFTDSRDGRTYTTVKIGEKWWMAENLSFLPNVKVPTTGSDSLDFKYVYDQIACGCLGKAKANANFKTYGVLYNWTSANANVPAGWHLPTNEEWAEMEEFINNNSGAYTNTDEYWENIGGHLKTTDGWDNDSNGSDNYGFSCLPGGFRSADAGEFLGLTQECYFWTASETEKSKAWGRTINVNSSNLHKAPYPKSSGFSVRCVKDE